MQNTFYLLGMSTYCSACR